MGISSLKNFPTSPGMNEKQNKKVHQTPTSILETEYFANDHTWFNWNVSGSNNYWIMCLIPSLIWRWGLLRHESINYTCVIFHIKYRSYSTLAFNACHIKGPQQMFAKWEKKMMRKRKKKEGLIDFSALCSVSTANQLNSPSHLTFPNGLHLSPSLALQGFKLILIH